MMAGNTRECGTSRRSTARKDRTGSRSSLRRSRDPQTRPPQGHGAHHGKKEKGPCRSRSLLRRRRRPKLQRLRTSLEREAPAREREPPRVPGARKGGGRDLRENG